MRSTVAGTTAVAAVIALGVGLAPAGASAPDPDGPVVPASVFARAKAGARVGGAPAEQTRSTEITVIAQLTGEPVAARLAARPTGKAASAATLRARVQAEQRAVATRVAALGGAVLGDYQTVYNGLKVRIRQDRVGDLQALPGVAAVHATRPVRLNNTQGVPVIGAAEPWGDGLTGLLGEGIKIGVVDTGIDYTHADFGGPGTTAAYWAARAAGTEPAPSALLGPAAPKIKGGVDLVGDAFDPDPDSATYDPVPRPDPNPLDCNGHGTHVAGTAAGFGVIADGRTYRGRYNRYTHANQSWRIGPGVAPRADLYAVRVAGCRGGTTTDVLVDAIEWAVEHDLDVLNVSLGNPYGTRNSPEAVAADNATKAGLIVVAAAGDDGEAPNSGESSYGVAPYLVQTPAAADGAISVAAVDTVRSFPAARLTLNTGETTTLFNANQAELPAQLPVVQLLDGEGQPSNGCDPQVWQDNDVSGALAVVWKWWVSCDSAWVVAQAQRAGAAAVFVRDESLRYLGSVPRDPADGSDIDVTIPVLAPQTFSTPLFSSGVTSAQFAPATIDNPQFRQVWTLSSSGPRYGDSWLKPDVAAPGVAVSSARSGSGDAAAVMSGTSMATAFTSGLAALVKQAHPGWTSAVDLRAAVVETAHAAKVPDYRARRVGNGLLQADPATRTEAVALGANGSSALNYGYAELIADHQATRALRVVNHADEPVTFQVKPSQPLGRPHTLTLDSTTVTVPAHGSATLNAQLRVPARTAGSNSSQDRIATVHGLVTLTPVDGGNAGVGLRVPYFFVPRASSHITATLDTEELVRTGRTTGQVSNVGVANGDSYWTVWGLTDEDEPSNRENDIAAAGSLIQRPARYGDFTIAFRQRMSNAASSEYFVYFDVEQDGTDDYVVIGLDRGLVIQGRRNGWLASVFCDLRAPLCPDAGRYDEWLTGASDPIDTTVVTLTSANPGWGGAFRYSVGVHGLFGRPDDTVEGSAIATTSDAFPALFAYAEAVPPGRFGRVYAQFSPTEVAYTGALGFMVVTRQNQAHLQAQFVRVDPSAVP